MAPKNHILVVEPDDLIRDLLQRWLAEAGYAVAVSVTPHPPNAVTPKVVIADIPGAERAAATVKALREAYPSPIPIIALSARFRRGLGGSLGAAQQLEVRTVVPKPFTREELLVAVAEAIEHPDTS